MAHECLIEYCPRQVEDHHTMCDEHYRLLPREMTNEIRRGYGVGMTRYDGSTGLMRALARANNYIQEKFAVQAKSHDPGKWERLCRMVRDKDAARAALRAAKAESGEPEPAASFRHLRLVP